MRLKLLKTPLSARTSHSPKPLRFARGDTMVEVMMAITIYSIVAIFTITVMRLGMQQAEATLELSQARIEVSAQADSIRFIHNSFLSEREYALTTNYKALWNLLISKAYNSDASNFPSLNTSDGTCPSSVADSFIINPRNISPTSPSSTIIFGSYVQTDLYPRLIFGASDANSDTSYQEGTYTSLYRAEGIYVVARKSASTSSLITGASQPEYYDFHIYACWFASGASHPSTTGTIIRLYNPALRESLR